MTFIVFDSTESRLLDDVCSGSSTHCRQHSDNYSQFSQVDNKLT